jgi:hypothetical protein
MFLKPSWPQELNRCKHFDVLPSGRCGSGFARPLASPLEGRRRQALRGERQLVVCDFAPNAARGDGISDEMQTLNLSRARSFYWSI